MAENVTQWPAGAALLALLQARGLAKEDVQTALGLVAEIIEQSRSSSTPAHPVAPALAAAPADAQRDTAAAEALLPGLSLILPRGKYDLAFFPDGLQLSSKTAHALVRYSAVRHVLVIDAIPKQPGTTHIVLVMHSDQPVQQGKQQHGLIAIQTKDAPELLLPAPPSAAHLGPNLAGPAAVVLSQLLASYLDNVDDTTFLTADASVFRSAAGDLMVAANRGASSGWLLPLAAGLAYVGRPGAFVPRAELSRAVFHRAGGSSATFDLTLKMLSTSSGDSAAAAARPLELGLIDASELTSLQAYFAAQGVRVVGDDDDESDDADADGAIACKEAAAAAGAAGGAAADHDSDEDDDDYKPGESDDDAAPRRKRSRITGGGGDAAEHPGSSEDDDEEEMSASGCDSDDEGSSDVSLIDEALLDDEDDEEDD